MARYAKGARAKRADMQWSLPSFAVSSVPLHSRSPGSRIVVPAQAFPDAYVRWREWRADFPVTVARTTPDSHRTSRSLQSALALYTQPRQQHQPSDRARAVTGHRQGSKALLRGSAVMSQWLVPN